MELTGKCKESFEKWYLQWVFNEKTFLSLNFSSEQIIENWNSLHYSEKYGVLVDFFDSVGIEVGVVKNRKGTFNSWCASDNDWDVMSRALPTQNTRPEARTKAIEKSNEFYNNL